MSEAAILLENLQSQGVTFSTENGKLKVDSPERKLSPEIKSLLTIHKAEIIQKLTGNELERLKPEIIELINKRAAEWDEIGRKTANKFKWSEASLF